jgi:hypothetical protein
LLLGIIDSFRSVFRFVPVQRLLPGKDAVCRHEELESDHRWR